MSNEETDVAVERALQALGDRRTLLQQGIDPAWIQRCELLVREYGELKRQFQELEAQLAVGSEGAGNDTIVM